MFSCPDSLRKLSKDDAYEREKNVYKESRETSTNPQMWPENEHVKNLMSDCGKVRDAAGFFFKQQLSDSQKNTRPNEKQE